MKGHCTVDAGSRWSRPKLRFDADKYFAFKRRCACKSNCTWHTLRQVDALLVSSTRLVVNDVKLTHGGQRQVIQKWSLSTSETIRILFCFRRVFELVITRNQSTLDGGRGDNSRP